MLALRQPGYQKESKAMVFKITKYADEILEATDDLNWTEMVKTMQKTGLANHKVPRLTSS